MTTTTQWIISIVVALIGGGAMGAVINALVTKYKNRRQPVVYKMEVIEAFKKNPDLEANLALQINDPLGTRRVLEVDRLSVASIRLTNEGNQDSDEFEFGITMKGTNEAVRVIPITQDRHHKVEVLTPVDFTNPTRELDFRLRPFHRGDPYTLNVYFTYEDSPGSIELSTAHPTVFIETKQERGVAELLMGNTVLLVIAGALLSTFLSVFISYSFRIQERRENALQELIEKSKTDEHSRRLLEQMVGPSPTPTTK